MAASQKGLPGTASFVPRCETLKLHQTDSDQQPLSGKLTTQTTSAAVTRLGRPPSTGQPPAAVAAQLVRQ